MEFPQSKQGWRALAGSLSIRTQAFINGRFVDAKSGRTFACVSPVDGQTLAQVAECGGEDVERAVRAARAAFEARHWAGMAPRERKCVLLRLAELIDQHRAELALLETLDMGKPIGASSSVDVPNAARCFAWYAEAIDKVYGEVAPTADEVIATIRREPMGVVGAVVPWNFPLLMATWKLAPALAAGNSVVLKPAEQSPLSALRLAELATEAGLPDGVLNVVPGFGPVAGQAIGLHRDVDALVFTGSTQVGKLFLQYAGQSNMKRVGLECGGKSPNIIFADAPDLDEAADAAATAIFSNQGEVCTAGSRLIVEAPVHDAVVERIVAHAKALKPSDPLDPTTRLGALVDGAQMERVLEYVHAGQAEAATLRAGGRRAREASGGFYVEPTVFDRVDNAMRIAREEIFGPVLSVITVESVEGAIRVANETAYGLAAAVWTRDINTAHRVAGRLRSGVVWINCYDDDDITVPVGGFKQSGLGRDKSLHALDKYTEIKTTWLRLR